MINKCIICKKEIQAGKVLCDNCSVTILKQKLHYPKCMKAYIKIKKKSGKYNSVWKPTCNCNPDDIEVCLG